MKKNTMKSASDGMPLHFPNSALNKPRAHNRYTSGKFNTKYFMLSLFFLSLLLNQSFGATRTADQNGNWNSASTWQGGNIPTASDIVIIDRSITVTVNVNNAACLSLQLNDGGNGTAVIAFNASSQLTVSGLVTIGATGNSNRRGSINMTSGGTLICNGFVVNFVNTFTPGLGTVKLMASNILPSTIFGTFYNLHIGSGTTSASAAISVTHTFTTDAAATMDMLTFPLTVSGVAHSGILQTKNTSAAPITASKTWGGTVQYNALTGGQTIMEGTYNTLTLSNTSGTQSASGNISCTTLNTSLGGLFDMITHTLAVTTSNNLGNIRTQNTSATPISAGVSWGGTFQFNGVAAQTIPSGSFDNLTINNSSGITASGNVSLSGILALGNGNYTTSTFKVTVGSAGSITGASASSYIVGMLGLVYGGTASKVFPIGKGGNYLPVTFQYTALTGISTVEIEQIEAAMSGTLPPNISMFADRFWSVNQSGGSAFTYNISLNEMGFTNLATAKMLQNSAITITAHPVTYSSPDYTSSGLTTLSEFTLGYECDLVGSITGVVSVCEDATENYSVSALTSATAYVWTVPSDATINSGQNSTSINVTFGSVSGDVTVKPVNDCNNNDSSFVSVSVTLFPIVSITPTGSLTFAQGDSVVLTSSAGTDYLWSTSATTQSITVYTRDTIFVNTAVSGCVGTSPNTNVFMIPDITLTTGFCGYQATSFGDYISADFVADASSFYFQFTDSADNSIVFNKTGSTKNINLIGIGLVYGHTYDVVLHALVHGVWGRLGNSCKVYAPPIPSITLDPSFCGYNLPSLVGYISANRVVNATQYSFQFTDSANNSNVITKVNGTRNLSISNIGLVYGRTYEVVVKAYVGGAWGTYGNICKLYAPAIPIITLTTAFCGYHAGSLGDYISTYYVDSASAYNFQFTDSSDNSIVFNKSGATKNVNLSGIGLVYGRTYDVVVRAMVDGVWGSFGSVCKLYAPGIPIITLETAFCGYHATAYTDYISTHNVVGATSYYFQFTDSADNSIVLSKTGTTRNINLVGLGLVYNHTYEVVVRAMVDGAWGGFGSVCMVYAPSIPSISLTTAFCGYHASSFSDYISTDYVDGATSYYFQFTDSADNSIVLNKAGSTKNINLTGLSLVYNHTYEVVVRAMVDGVWGSFGSVCMVYAPSIPSITLNTSSCGYHATAFSDYISTYYVVGATLYYFQFTDSSDNSNVFSKIGGTKNISLSDIGLSYGATYEVVVKAMIDGVYGSFGSVCMIYTPAPPRLGANERSSIETNGSSENQIILYPNPFNTSFTIHIDKRNSEPVQMKIFDVSGRLINALNLPAGFIDQSFGNDLTAGIYFVEIKCGADLKKIKLLKIE